MARCRGCLTVNPPRKRLCGACGRRIPKKRRAAHNRALDLTYDQYIALNGGEHCGICGKPPGNKKLHRDHAHVGQGIPRGLLCFRCNSGLRNYMTLDWLRRAVTYLERTTPEEDVRGTTE